MRLNDAAQMGSTAHPPITILTHFINHAPRRLAQSGAATTLRAVVRDKSQGELYANKWERNSSSIPNLVRNGGLNTVLKRWTLFKSQRVG
jgi:hypothetical protein